MSKIKERNNKWIRGNVKITFFLVIEDEDKEDKYFLSLQHL